MTSGAFLRSLSCIIRALFQPRVYNIWPLNYYVSLLDPSKNYKDFTKENLVKSFDTYLNLCTHVYELSKPDPPEDAYTFYKSYVEQAGDVVLKPMYWYLGTHLTKRVPRDLSKLWLMPLLCGRLYVH